MINPSFSKYVKTNIGKKFFKLINRHFPKDHKMSKIFNKNMIKLSCGCFRNMGSVIASHNRRIIQLTSNNMQLDAIVETESNVHLIINV